MESKLEYTLLCSTWAVCAVINGKPFLVENEYTTIDVC